jgi:predicted porin
MNNTHRVLGPVLAAASLVAAPLAPAQDSIQVYGVLDAGAGTSKTSGEQRASTVVNSGGLTTSYWGIKGSERIGEDLKVLFNIEGYLLMDTGAAGRTASDRMFSRDTWVGLAGKWGELKIGRIINPLFYSTALSNPFGRSTRFAPLLTQAWTLPYGRVVSGDTSWDNTISFALPAKNGFKATAMWQAGETDFGTGTSNASINAVYSKGPLYATVHVQQVKVGPGVTQVGESAQRTYFVGGSYRFSMARAYASYTLARDSAPDRTVKQAQLGVAVPAGGGDILLSWARARNDALPAVARTRDTVGLGYDYRLSPRTDLYITSLYDKLSETASGTSAGAGIRHRF